jgi:hypothetical protein
MDMNVATLLRIVRLSIERPRAGARQIMNLNLSVGEAWGVLTLIAIGSTLMAMTANTLAPARSQPEFYEMAFASPFGLAALQLIVMGSAAAMMHVLGRWVGGTGQFAEALVLVGWVQAILLLLQLVQLVVLLIAPPLVAPIGLLGLGLLGWLLTNFTAELHGFRSLGKVFLCILGALIVFSLVLAVVLILFIGVRL